MKFRGGARIDSLNVTWPFASLEIDSNRILLRYLLASINIEPQNVEKISTYEGLFSRGIRIFPITNNLPAKIVFWCGNSKKVLQEISNTDFKSKVVVD